MAPVEDHELRANSRRHRAALRIALIYALVGSLWILGSDWLLSKLVSDPAWVIQVGAVKGWVFVAVTAGLLYLLVRRIPTGVRAPAPFVAPNARHRVLWVLLYAAIVGMTVAALRHDFNEKYTLQFTSLDTVAELQARLVSQGMNARVSQAPASSAAAPIWLSLYGRWRDDGDRAAHDELLDRITILGSSFAASRAFLVDERADMVMGQREGDRPSAALRTASLRALATGQIERTDPDEVEGRAWRVPDGIGRTAGRRRHECPGGGGSALRPDRVPGRRPALVAVTSVDFGSPGISARR